MARYRERLERDLDGWIAGSLVPAESRAAILASVGEARRLDASTALAVVGAMLGGVAAIALVAANWSDIPRVARFVLILMVFLSAASGAAWAQGKGRLVASQTLLCVAALVFAAAIGLTGQIFDIAGDPQAALRGAGLGALLLALAGRSPWAAAVGLVFLGLGDLTRTRFLDDTSAWPGWIAVVAPIGAGIALWRASKVLAHVAGLGCVVAVLTFDRVFAGQADVVFLTAAMVLGAAALVARALPARAEGPAGVLYGWWAAGALLWFGVSGGVGDTLGGVEHSGAWMTLSVAALALGRHDRHVAVTAVGVISLLAAGAFLLFNLGVGLLTSAAVFGGAAVVALGVAFVMRRAVRS